LKKEPEGTFRAKLFSTFAMQALALAVIEARFDRRRRSVEELLDLGFAMLFQKV